MTLCLGKLDPDHDRPALMLAPHLTQLSPPTRRDWLSKVKTWPMYANDVIGDCVWAAIGHAVQAWTAYATGTPVELPLAALLKGYHDVAGFDPSDPQTDRGTVLQDALEYWAKVGVAGHRIIAFAKVDHRNPVELAAATDVFGALLIGIQFPASAMSQFQAGKRWTVARRDGGIQGGHAIHLGAFDPRRYAGTTWGREQAMTHSFLSKYIDEAWAVITREWLDATGHSPQGVDLQGLGRALQDLTGRPNPLVLGPH